MRVVIASIAETTHHCFGFSNIKIQRRFLQSIHLHTNKAIRDQNSQVRKTSNSRHKTNKPTLAKSHPMIARKKKLNSLINKSLTILIQI